MVEGAGATFGLGCKETRFNITIHLLHELHQEELGWRGKISVNGGGGAISEGLPRGHSRDVHRWGRESCHQGKSPFKGREGPNPRRSLNRCRRKVDLTNPQKGEWERFLGKTWNEQTVAATIWGWGILGWASSKVHWGGNRTKRNCEQGGTAEPYKPEWKGGASPRGSGGKEEKG